MRKLPPIHTWTERVDDQVIAGFARCHHVVRNHCRERHLYGLEIFVLYDIEQSSPWRSPRWAEREAAERVREKLAGHSLLAFHIRRLEESE